MSTLPGYDAWKTMCPDDERDRNEEPAEQEFEEDPAEPEEPEDDEPGEPLDSMRGVDFPFADNH